MTYYHKK